MPFWRGERQRDLAHAAARRADQDKAGVALDAAKARRDRIGERLGELSPWNPFQVRERRQLEAGNRAANRAVAGCRHTLDECGGRVAAAGARVGERQTWLARHQPDHDQLPALHDQLDQDLQARIERAGVNPAPYWAINILGVRPAHGDLAGVWDHTVGRVEHYRTIHTITSDHEPIGAPPHPGNPDDVRWAGVAADLGGAAMQLGREQDLEAHLRHHLGLDRSLGHGISL
ncbi:MAG: hypothetical protein AB7G23_20555 [Vicinamibacterales bacterium]